MSTTSHRPAATRLSRIAAAVLALVGATTAGAQPLIPAERRAAFELRPFAGAYLPTGDQRDALRDAFHLGVQASYPIIPQFAVVGTFAWSASKNRAAARDAAVDVLHYDAGVEGRAAGWRRGGTWDFTPFAGIGLGARTYNPRHGNTDSQTKFAGYGAIGGEFGIRRIGLRFEARDYLSQAGPVNGRDESGTRNDVTLAAGLTVRF